MTYFLDAALFAIIAPMCGIFACAKAFLLGLFEPFDFKESLAGLLSTMLIWSTIYISYLIYLIEEGIKEERRRWSLWFPEK